MSDEPENISFLEHLDQLRGTLLKMLGAFLLCCIPCWFVSQQSMDYLLAYAAPGDVPMHYFSLMEPFVTRLKVMAFLALVVSIPWSARCLWGFLKPGLLQDERKAVVAAFTAIFLLALLGAAVALLFIVPAVFTFSLSFAGPTMQPVLGIGDFVGLVLVVMLAAMALFQFPVVLFLLLRLGFINLSLLRRKRPHVIVVIFILAAVFSPPDVLSQLLLAIPSWLLFEASLCFFGKYFKEHDRSYDDIYKDSDAEVIQDGADAPENK